MIKNAGSRYFDISTILILCLAAMLLVSIPGGCWSDDGGDDEPDNDVEAVAEPTAPPTMEIVDPEPGDINTSDPPAEDGEGDSGDSSEDEAAGESGEQDEEAAPDDGTYVVQEGDTLYDIAVEFGVTMEDLMAANGIEDPNSLQVGQELQIP